MDENVEVRVGLDREDAQRTFCRGREQIDLSYVSPVVVRKPDGIVGRPSAEGRNVCKLSGQQVSGRNEKDNRQERRPIQNAKKPGTASRDQQVMNIEYLSPQSLLSRQTNSSSVTDNAADQAPMTMNDVLVAVESGEIDLDDTTSTVSPPFLPDLS